MVVKFPVIPALPLDIEVFLCQDIKLSTFIYDIVESNEKMENLYKIIPYSMKVSR